LSLKLDQTGLVLAYNHGSLVGLNTQDYKSLCAVVMICSILVNIQTHTSTQTDNILTSLPYMKSSGS